MLRTLLSLLSKVWISEVLQETLQKPTFYFYTRPFFSPSSCRCSCTAKADMFLSSLHELPVQSPQKAPHRQAPAHTSQLQPPSARQLNVCAGVCRTLIFDVTQIKVLLLFYSSFGCFVFAVVQSATSFRGKHFSTQGRVGLDLAPTK